jgi:hypothetical protein
MSELYHPVARCQADLDDGRSSLPSKGRKPTALRRGCVVAIFAPRMANTRRTARDHGTPTSFQIEVALVAQCAILRALESYGLLTFPQHNTYLNQNNRA